MPRRKQDGPVDPDGPPSYEDKINESVYLSNVLGQDLAEILANARIIAAHALSTRPENIYIKSNTDLVIAARERFGEKPRPTLWRSSVSCGLVPEHLRIG
jgi:hypothetical protein